RRNRRPDRCHQERRRGEGASAAADAAPVAAEAQARPAHPEGGEAQNRASLGAELLMADRPSRRQELPLLQRGAAARKALLRAARQARLHPSEEFERGLSLSLGPPRGSMRRLNA